MSEVSASVRIARPCEQVFDFISEPSNWPSFRPSLVFTEPIEGRGIGERVRCATRVAGHDVSWTAEVAEHDRPRRYAVRAIDGPAPFALEWTLTDDGEGGCVLQFRQEAPEPHGLVARLAERFVTPRYEAEVRERHARLAQLVEAS